MSRRGRRRGHGPKKLSLPRDDLRKVILVDGMGQSARIEREKSVAGRNERILTTQALQTSEDNRLVGHG